MPKLDLDRLPGPTRKRVEKALAPRDTMLSRRFPAASVAAWQRAAKATGVSLTDWIEAALDAAVQR